jgi:hypothetical protein
MDLKYPIAAIFLAAVILAIVGFVLMPYVISFDVALIIVLFCMFSILVMFTKKRYYPR